MRPEDIDKLFKERLGPTSPTPPADLWNRLQDRIETEMPSTNEQEQKPRSFMWLSYSIAAAIALVLSVGIVFYNVQRGGVPVEGMANNNGQVAEQPLIMTESSTVESAPEQGIAQAEPAGTAGSEDSAIPEATEATVKAPAKVKGTPNATIAKVESKSTTKQVNSKTSTNAVAPAQQLVAQVEKPAIPDAPRNAGEYNTGETMPVSFASNTADMNAQPVEIIIKRAVAVQQAEESEELSGFEKKQKLAKNIFKQVRNLSNGERVELSELGIHADRIALETQIGKQKISKVINL